MEENCIAFKLNYCDGGANQNCIGFRGLCSDENIFYNVINRNRPWCSHDDNYCKRYWCKKISRDELESRWEKEDANFCDESITLNEEHGWYAVAGWNSDEKTPRKFKDTDMINHLCVLTTKLPRSDSLIIFAMFIVRDAFKGDNKNPGKVCADKYWRLKFRRDEAEKMKFRDVYTKPWSRGLFRYFSDKIAVKFLEMAVDVKRGTPEEDFAKEFLKNYPYK